MEKTIVYDPLNEYETIYKNKFHEKVLNDFDKKIQACGVDLNANHELNTKIEKLENRSEDQNKHLSRVIAAFSIVTVLCIAGILGSVIAFFNLDKYLTLCIIFGIIFFIGLIVEIIIFSKKIKQIKCENNETKSSINELKDAGYTQMYEYNHHADSETFDRYFNGTIPGVELERFVSNKTFEMLLGHGAKLRFSDCSCVGCKSGTINQNPFIIINNKHHYMGTKTYFGETYIEWEEEVTDENGETHTETHSETLTASVTKPYPEYNHGAALYFYSDASKKLTFNRTNHTNLLKADDKEIREYVEHHERSLQKYADKAVKENFKFTPIANTEFETMFQAWNRNNEVDYRMLFTPLAQTNMCKVLGKAPVKDDLDFNCRYGLNTLTSENICNQALAYSRYNFIGFSYERLRKQMSDILDKAFKEMYFSLAPLLAIPSYQQSEPEKVSNTTILFSPLEEEFFANQLPKDYFLLPESRTPAMIQVEKSEQYGTLDIVTLRCSSYKIKEHVETFTEMGGDGEMHDIDVYWDEYIPIEKKVMVGLKKLPHGDRTFNAFERRFKENYSYLKDYVVNKGVLAFIANEAMKDDFNEKLDIFFDPMAALK